MVAITRQTLADEINRQQKLAQDINQAQIAVSSGKRLTAPSDDVQSWVEISDIGKMQASTAAWTDNTTYGQSRSSKAGTNLDEISNLMSRAQELLVAASSTASGDGGRTATLADLKGIRETISSLLNETDYQGVPVFDNGTTVKIPVGRGTQLEAVGTRQSVAEGIDVKGTAMSLDDILASAIAAVDTGDDASRTAALDALGAGLNHVIGEQSKQGVRDERLSSVAGRLSDATLSLNEKRSTLEDTDLTETISKMQQKLLTLQAAQATFAKINQKSLFDLIS